MGKLTAIAVKAAMATPGTFQDGDGAKRLHISADTLRDWEQGRRLPDASARALLGMVAVDPDTACACWTASPHQPQHSGIK